MIKVLITAGFQGGQKRISRHFFCLVSCLWITWIAAIPVAWCGGQDVFTRKPFRLAFSSSMFTEVNVDDARAAMKVWLMTAAREHDIVLDSEPYIHTDLDGLIKLGLEKSVAGFALITPEFARMRKVIKFDKVAVGSENGFITEEYCLLVHRDSGLDRLEQLQGRHLNVLNNPRMSLGLIWFDTVLMNSGFRRASEFFSSITLNKNASLVALPCFSRRTTHAL